MNPGNGIETTFYQSFPKLPLYHFFIKMRLIQPTQVGFVWVAPLFQSEGDLAQSHTELVLRVSYL